MNLKEDILRLKVYVQPFLKFTEDLRKRLNETKAELDATLNKVDLDKSNAVISKDETGEVVADLETAVQEQLNEIEEDEILPKLREALTLQYKAAQFIVTLKAKLKETNELNEQLLQKASKDHDTMLHTVDRYETENAANEERRNITMSNRIQLTELIALNPPPLFDTNSRFGSASGLLLFFNEDLEDYFSDICVEDKTEKCRLLLKIFGDKSEEYKRTTRRFFKQIEIQTLIDDPATEMRIVYKELVHYMFVEKPKGNVDVRKSSESLTNFLERWFTLKDYCGIPANKQGKSVIAGIFKNPNILNCSVEVIREFKKQFFVKHANDQNIDKAVILGFAQRLDMLFSRENELGVHALNSAVGVRDTVMIANDKQRRNDDINDIQSLLADIVTELELYQDGGMQHGLNIRH